MTMIERIARAIEAKAEEIGIVFTNDEADEYARAALAEMREPTEAMIGACKYDQKIAERWRAMVDAAMEEADG